MYPMLKKRKRYLTLSILLYKRTSLATFFLVHTAQLTAHLMHWDISENLLNKLDIQLAINLKS